MLSQIQPHFLYNSLTAIRQLCNIDPQKAKQTVTLFSRYLRGNTESLTTARCIPRDHQDLQYNIAVDMTKLDCDFYRFLAWDMEAVNAYSGEYMSNYGWAEFMVGYLDSRVR